MRIVPIGQLIGVPVHYFGAVVFQERRGEADLVDPAFPAEVEPCDGAVGGGAGRVERCEDVAVGGFVEGTGPAPVHPGPEGSSLALYTRRIEFHFSYVRIVFGEKADVADAAGCIEPDLIPKRIGS